MRRIQRLIIGFACCAALFTACKEEDDATYNMYTDWQTRNTQYFANVADTARRAIASAKATYGNLWEDHCDWRMYRSTALEVLGTGTAADSVCVRILTRGTGSGSPLWSDTVRVNYRGWLIPATNEDGKTVQTVFDQSYYGNYNVSTDVPRKMGVTPSISNAYSTTYENTIGLATALQQMHIGDTWMVYVPYNLGYGAYDITLGTRKTEYRISLASGGYSNVYAKEDIHSYNITIPACSMLQFKVNLAAYYRSGIVVPDWE